tara:strand:+ start:370 stop:1107 length:738 start_codon:yes stop_codon:yes gene_type:complete
MNMGKKKHNRDQNAVVGYVRVSTKDQTVEQQEYELKAWCDARGLDLKAVYSEVGVSGGADLEKRTGLLEAFTALDKFNAGIFLASKRDRVARDVAKAAMITKMIQDQGSKLITTDGAGEDDSPEGVMFAQLLDVFAQFEKAKIRMRIISKLNERKREGKLTGTNPIGTKILEDGKTLWRDPEEFAAVLRVEALWLAGEPIRAIARLLNAEGFKPRGAKWHPTTVMRIVDRLNNKEGVLNRALVEG